LIIITSSPGTTVALNVPVGKHPELEALAE